MAASEKRAFVSTAPASGMRAFVFTGPAPDTSNSVVLRLPTPSPSAGEVAIAVDFAGINFKDVMARRGDEGYVARWPFTPGLEVAGTVCALGLGVESFQVGQPVAALTNSGGLAEVAVARAALTTPVPEGVELRHAAAVPGALTTAFLLLDVFARVRPRDVVLVHSAAGSVGQAVATLGRRRSLRLVGAVGAASRRAAALDAGFEAVLIRGASLAADVRELLGGGGVDVVLDPQGTDWLHQDLAALAPGGRVVLFGNASGANLEPLPPARALYASNAAIGGFSLAALSVSAPAVVREAMAGVLELIATHQIRQQIVEIDGLANASTAQQAVADGTATVKQVVRVNS